MTTNMNIKTRERFFRYGNAHDLIQHVIVNVAHHQWEIQKSLKSNKFDSAMRHLGAVIYECNTLETIKGNPEDPEEGVRQITAQIKEILDYMIETDGVTTLPEKLSSLHMYLRVICDDLDKYKIHSLK